MGPLLKGRTALVTGAASGIGAAIVKEMSEQGATVLGIDRQDGLHSPILLADLSDTENLPNLLHQAEVLVGGIDILVNCAGVAYGQELVDLTWEMYDKTLRVNLHAPVFLMSLLGKKMCEKGYGRILNITSVHGKLSEPSATAYDVSKGGLESATRTAALELASGGVLVNAVAPGFVTTPMSRADGEDELESEWFKTIYVKYARLPLLRPAHPMEIAKHVAFLCSDQNTYLTGQVITVDGGLSARF
jgi:NAD(P)-dependent dehydrogenase (short-subunit alcohol dehydrogenase family)